MCFQVTDMVLRLRTAVTSLLGTKMARGSHKISGASLSVSVANYGHGALSVTVSGTEISWAVGLT